MHVLKMNVLALNRFIQVLLIGIAVDNVNAQEVSDSSDTISAGTDRYVETGYGRQTRLGVTGPVFVVHSEDFNPGYINSPQQLIQGRVTGLWISRPGANPNKDFYMRIRALGTINAEDQPLIVVDGFSGASLENIDPDDIESVSVLKGSAASIYGLRGAGGVIIINTKNSFSGSHIEYNGYITAETVAKNTPVMTASEWRKLSKEVGMGTDYGASTDWFKEIEQTGFSQTHNLSASGGSENTFYRISLNYRDVNGILKYSGFNKINGRINLTQKAFRDHFTLDINLSATEKKSDFGFDEVFRYAATYNPTAPVKSNSPEYERYDGYFQQMFFDFYNPVSVLKLDRNEGRAWFTDLSLKASLKVTRGLRAEAIYTRQSIGTLVGQYFDRNEYLFGYNRNGLASKKTENKHGDHFVSTLNYYGNAEATIYLNILAGYSYMKEVDEGFSIQTGDFLTDHFSFNNLSASGDYKNGLAEINSFKNSHKMVGFFGRMNLILNKIWFLNAGARYEGSSRFGENNKWTLFPFFGAGVGSSKIKFRMNYGISGNIPPESYLSIPKLETLYWNYRYIYNGSWNNIIVLKNNANPDLGPERKEDLDFGVDFSLIKNRISGSVELYFSNTKDLIYKVRVPRPPNLAEETWINGGKLKSRGMELFLDFRITDKPGFKYNMGLMASWTFKNELESLSGSYNGRQIEFQTEDLGYPGSPGMCCSPLVRLEEKSPIGQLIGFNYEGIGEDGLTVITDHDQNGWIDSQDRVVIGNGLPKFMLGLSNSASYRNWDFNLFFRAVTGHSLMNSNRLFYEVPYMVNTYNVIKTAADRRNSNGILLRNSSQYVTDNQVESASFLAVDNLSIGYHFNLEGESIRIYLAGNNLFYISRYKGTDPNPRFYDEAVNMGSYNSLLVPGIDRRETWSRARSVSLGINLSF